MLKYEYRLLTAAAVLLLAAAIGIAYFLNWISHGATTGITSEEIESLGHPTDVAIAACLAYLGLDRFRYRKRISDRIAHLGKFAEKTLLLDRLSRDALTLDQKNILILLANNGDKSVGEKIRKATVDLRTEFWMSASGRWVRWFIIPRIDRSVIMFVLLFLCLYQLAAAYCQISGKVFPGPHSDRAIWMIYSIVCAGYFLTGLFVMGNDLAMDGLDRAAGGWEASMKAVEIQNTARNAPSPVDPSTSRR